jgi:hypothetical protein
MRPRIFWPNIILGLVDLACLIVAIYAAFQGDWAKAAAFVGFAIYAGSSRS